MIVSWCWFDSCLGNGSQASWTGAIPLPRVSLRTLGIVASRSQGLTFFEPPDHRRNTPFPALIFKVPEKTSIGQLEVTCQHLNQSLRSLGKIQLNGPAELSPTLLLKSCYRKNRGQSHCDRRAPISVCLHNHVTKYLRSRRLCTMYQGEIEETGAEGFWDLRK